ncbi:hypothetical protein GCM10027159_10610 [Lysobacter terrae]
MTVRRLAWWAQRHYLRYGMASIVAATGFALLVALSAATAWSHLRLTRAERELSARMDTLHALSRPQAHREKVAALPLPAIAERFELNRRIIAALKTAGLEPERIRFKFEPVQDAGLTRQVAVFTLKARWAEIASALERLQAADRSLYLSRLRVSRDAPSAELVSAEVQLAVAMVDDSVAAGGGR